MRIKNISIVDLFGIFDHEISLNEKDRITIIHGPNGYGKTILLTMVDALFKRHYSKLREIPYKEFIITFNDETSLHISKHDGPQEEDYFEEEDYAGLLFEYKDRGEIIDSFVVPKTRTEREHFSIFARIIDHEIPDLDRVGPRAWVYFPTQEILSEEDVVDRFSEMFPPSIRAQLVDIPKWLKEINDSIHIRFIETQRLLNFPRSKYKGESRKILQLTPAVVNYSKELVNEIRDTLASYASLSQSLDRTFPTRIVKASEQTELTIDELRSNLGELEKKREGFIITGLLDKEEEIDFKDFQDIDDSNRNVLSIYIEDVKKKLGILDELSEKIDLLVKIVNRKFAYKQMSISKEEGFVFSTNEGRVLSPSSLSSGEQHELVLLYELLFKVKPDSLVLIDEPELSLHIEWQQQFLKDLLEVTKLTGFDVLIATHSPQIIHDRWDLTVELEGPSSV